MFQGENDSRKETIRGSTKSKIKWFLSQSTPFFKQCHSFFSVQILAEEAHSLDAFDANEAKKALDEAQSLVNAAGDDAAKAEAQIAVEVADALVKALAWNIWKDKPG